MRPAHDDKRVLRTKAGQRAQDAAGKIANVCLQHLSVKIAVQAQGITSSRIDLNRCANNATRSSSADTKSASAGKKINYCRSLLHHCPLQDCVHIVPIRFGRA